MPGIHPDFHQDGPKLQNAFDSDPILKSYLHFRLPQSVASQVFPELSLFGARCVGEFLGISQRAEIEEPQHVPFDPWGRRIDEIRVSGAWNELHEIAAREGLVSIGYERVYGEYSRLVQFAKLYLFHPSSAFYTCPLAMTDGAARVIELHGDQELKARAFKHLTSRDPEKFWTSGQWMTERTGGSDVSGTSTVARSDGRGGFGLFGDKWFTSATTSEMTMALAKVEGATDTREGLSLFYAELRDDRGQLKQIRINRLKDKLGTKALPTAELTLEGTPAKMVGGVGEGVKKVASILNITRLYNSVTALGTMARAMALAKDYAKRREAFGRKLSEQPLHLETLADLEVEFEATVVLGFHLIHLLGKEETGQGNADETAILRLLTPVIKLWSAKQCISLVSEVLESFGGAGYIEDTGLPRLLRDSQVFSIWEGTTNVLSLDVLRAMSKDQALIPYLRDVEARLVRVNDETLKSDSEKIRLAAREISERARDFALASPEAQQAGARAFAFGLARVLAASLLIEFADANSGVTQGKRIGNVVRRFLAKPLVAVPDVEDLKTSNAAAILYGN